MIKVTALMASRWVKAAFLAILGIVILLYANRFVDDMRGAMEGNFDVAFEWTWDLLMVLLWILVAWLFVDAALTVALSFSERRYTLLDVMKRLDKIEKRLGIAQPPAEPLESEEPEVEEEEKAAPEEEVPPPPKEES
jgi:hypothetical protein